MNTSIRNVFLAICLTLPVITKVLFPSSLEELLELQIGNIPIFMPNILLLVFFACSKKNKGELGLKLVFWLQFFFMMAGFLYNDYKQNSWGFLLSGNYYYYILLIGLYCRINWQIRIWIARIYTLILFVLGLEVILLGLGIISGFGAMVIADSAQEFGDFYRVSTTAGAATSTAVHLYMLTAICIMLSHSSKWRYVLFFYGFSTTLLTVSRGGTIAFFMYMFLWFFFKIKEKKAHMFKIIWGFGGLLVVLYIVGIFNPIIERMEVKTQNDTMLESREDRAGKALYYFYSADSKFLGVGISNLFHSTEINHLGYENVVAPHNSYVQTLCEQGIIGLVLMIIFWSMFIFINRSSKALLIPMIPLLIVFWNTESAVVVLSDYIVSLSIFVMLSLDKKRQSELCIL